MEDVIVESIQIMGHNCYYIPRESLDNVDLIFGETTKVKFRHSYIIEAYIANVEGYEGDGDFFSKFGLDIRDTSNFVISRRSFNRIIPNSLRQRPQEGDLVWVPLLHRMFEIKFIEKKLMFYSLGNRHPFVYEMRCEVFRYSEEAFDTGVVEIDQVEEDNAYTIKLSLNTTGTGSFIDNEMIYQSANGNWNGATATAELSKWHAANGAMFLHNIVGTFKASANTYGNTSGAIYRTISNGVNDTGDFNSQDLINNDDFGKSTELVLDLSEINPFGSI